MAQLAFAFSAQWILRHDRNLTPIVMLCCSLCGQQNQQQNDTPPDGNSHAHQNRPCFGCRWVNGKCVGESAPNVFFYEEVKGGAEHKVATQSEFSPNELIVKAVAGVNDFFRQYMKMGLVVAGAGVEQVSEDEGKKEVAALELAKKGTCSK